MSDFTEQLKANAHSPHKASFLKALTDQIGVVVTEQDIERVLKLTEQELFLIALITMARERSLGEFLTHIKEQ